MGTVDNIDRLSSSFVFHSTSKRRLLLCDLVQFVIIVVALVLFEMQLIRPVSGAFQKALVSKNTRAFAVIGSTSPTTVTTTTSIHYPLPRRVRLFASVTGTAYSTDDPDAPVVVLYTKEGCTLCDKVKDVLKSLPQNEFPHSLEQVDITDQEHVGWYDKYKYDIPVLHINNKYWTKHRLDQVEAKTALTEALEGTFEPRSGEPDAAAMERKQAQRKSNQ
mmetsp:Transcript_24599/g.45914  ORF Transcript_24599/g.45914 Transcript_24599/m.45914 type:complete len:219 (-) Transcript_24599:2226-2882(-)